MHQSKLFSQTLREAPKDEVSQNAIWLTRAGYIDKLMAGVYSYLPMGLIVLNKIKDIIREEINTIGGQEIYMPALQPKELWSETGRWQGLKEIMFQFESRGNSEVGLGASHEENVVDIVRKRVNSYRDLPLYLYQIQDKFRNEPRAKSGLLRGREFSMKDLYSFHQNQESLDEFYNQAIKAYQKIFDRCGLKSIVTEASGGDFSKEHSHEFQVATEFGEDQIVVCSKCDFANNTEICQLASGDKCPNCGSDVKLVKSIEVGNIFKLGCKYSHDMKLIFADQAGQQQEMIMGCYGIGPSRVMGTVVEIYHDHQGITWPKTLAPFQVHLLVLSSEKTAEAEKMYQTLTRQGWEVLFDDRNESAGVKLKDADLIGLPVQLILGDKTAVGELEFKERVSGESKKIKISELEEKLIKIYR